MENDVSISTLGTCIKCKYTPIVTMKIETTILKTILDLDIPGMEKSNLLFGLTEQLLLHQQGLRNRKNRH